MSGGHLGVTPTLENACDLVFVGWQRGGEDITGSPELEGYYEPYFWLDFTYLGPDKDGIEPIYDLPSVE